MTYLAQCLCLFLEIATEIEQQRPVLEELQRVGHKLSEDGFIKLVEPRLIPINKRWEELHMKFEVYHVNVSMVKKLHII